METLRYTAAAVQYESQLGRVAENVAGLLRLAEQAAARGCRLIVLPEMATTGYCFHDRAEIAPLLEPLPGPTFERFAALAARHACYLVYGLAELDPATGLAYNSAACVGPRGLVGRMRKVHLTELDSRWARPGNLGYPVWQTDIGRLAAHICLDACYPEAARAAAVQGAQVVAFPTNWDSQRAPGVDWCTRAFENGVYFVVADRYGAERGTQFSGGSCILGPQGALLAHLDSGDGLAEAEIDLAQTHTRPWPWGAGDKLAERRPACYTDLALQPLRWPLPAGRTVYSGRALPTGGPGLLAAAQLAAVPDDVDAARQKVADLVRQAAQAALGLPQLIVLPELALVPDSALSAAGAWAESIPGPTSQWASALCRELGLYLALGLPQRAGPRLYNSALLAGPEGLLGVYRKMHLAAHDLAWAAPGDDGFCAFDVPSLGRVGLLIGHDALFPEAARCLAIQGADVLAAPSAMRGPRPLAAAPTRVPLQAEVLAAPSSGHWHLWRGRAGENNCYLAFANRAAGPHMGWSGVFGPNLYACPRAEHVIPGGGDALALLQIDTRDYLAPEKPNPVRLKPFVRGRATQFVEELFSK